MEFPQVQHTDETVDAAVMMQREVPTIHTAQTQRQVPVIQTVQRTAEPHRCTTVTEIVDIPVPPIAAEQIAEMVKVIAWERVSERTLGQIVSVPGEIPRARVQQRTVELEHQSQPGARDR